MTKSTPHVLQCKRCLIWFDHSDIEKHHIYPIQIRKENQSIEFGKRILLCRPCHVGLHTLREYLDALKMEDKNGIRKITEKYIGTDRL
jgi:predicted HNH restriction endonuclease